MTAFLLETLLLLLVAFLLGLFLGRLLKWLLCRARHTDVTATDGDSSVAGESTNRTAKAALAASGVAAAGAGIASAKAKIGDLKDNMPVPDRPIDAANASLPKAELHTTRPDVDSSAVTQPSTELPQAELPGVEPSGAKLLNIDTPEVTLPDTELADTELAQVELADAGLTVDAEVANAAATSAPDVSGSADAGGATDGLIAPAALATAGAVGAAVAGASETTEAAVSATAEADSTAGNKATGSAAADDAATISAAVDAATDDVKATSDTDTVEAAAESSGPVVKLPVVKSEEAEAEASQDSTPQEQAEDDTTDPGFLNRIGSSQVKLPQVKAEIAAVIAQTGAPATLEDSALVASSSQPAVKLPRVKAQLADAVSSVSTKAGTAANQAGDAVSGAGAQVEASADDVSAAAATTASNSVANDAAQLKLSDIPAIQSIMSSQSGKHSTQILWNAGAGPCRCSELASAEKIMLKPGEYESVGTVHCGVTRSGFVAVGGYVSDINDGQALLFVKSQVVACRDGDQHTFLYFEGI